MEANLKNFMTTELDKKGMTETNLLTEMGYRKMSKAQIHLNRFYQELEEPSQGFIRKVAEVLDMDMQEITAVIRQELAEKKEKMRAEERAKFKPYICAMCVQEVPQPIFAGNMTYLMRFTHFKLSLLEYGFEEQVKRVGAAIRRHYKKNGGRIPAFGAITHYVYRRNYDEKEEDILLFDNKGREIAGDQSLRRFEGHPSGIRVR